MGTSSSATTAPQPRDPRLSGPRAGVGGKVVAVHAFGPPPEWLGHPSYQRVLDDHRSRGEAVLRELAPERIPALAGVELETEVIASDPAEALVQVAKTRW